MISSSVTGFLLLKLTVSHDRKTAMPQIIRGAKLRKLTWNMQKK
jgi:hypothetical protein